MKTARPAAHRASGCAWASTPTPSVPMPPPKAAHQETQMFELDVRKLWLAWRAPICALMAAAAIGGLGGGGVTTGVRTRRTRGDKPTPFYRPPPRLGPLLLNRVSLRRPPPTRVVDHRR